MTVDMMTLRAFGEKTPDADLLREMIGVAAARLMALEVDAASGGAMTQRSEPPRPPQRLP